MNIDEYRAMVANEANEVVEVTEGVVPNVQTNEVSTTSAEQAVQASGETQHTPSNDPIEAEATPTPQEIEIDGVKVPLDEIRQGYLRQSDYTKKTQELARIKSQSDVASQYYNAIQSDPEFAEGLAKRFDLPYMDAKDAELAQVKSEHHALLLEREVEALQAKFKDVDIEQVVQVAYDKRLGSLEDAYHLVNANRAPVTDIEAMKADIRQQVLQEIQSNVDTSSIIGTSGSAQQVNSNIPELSSAELRVAQNMKMAPAEYAKWKNMK